jgi:tape measure domain-containing protein
MGGNIIETLAVAIEAATSSFNTAVGRAVSDAKGQLAEVEKPVELKADTGGLVAGVKSAVAGFTELGRTIFFAKEAVNTFIATAKGLTSFNARLEQSERGWATMLKSGELAKAMLFELQTFAAATPFNFEQVEQGARRLLAMGFAAREIIPTLRDIGNVAAGMSTGNEGIARMTLALGQMNAKAKVSQEEILQLTEAGVNAGEIFEIMARQTGKTVEELKGLQEKGRLASDVFINAFRAWSQEKFGDAMAQQTASFTGAISTIEDSLQIAQGTTLKPFFERFSQLAQTVAAFVQTDEFQVWGSRFAAVLDVVLEGVEGLVRTFTWGLGEMLSVAADVGQAIYEALSWLNPFATHSPSLVDQVEGGNREIADSYRDLSDSAKRYLAGATDAVREFGKVSKQEVESQRETVDRFKDALAAAKDELDRLKGVEVQGSKAFRDKLNKVEDEIAKVELSIAKAKLAGAKDAQLKGLNDRLEKLRQQADVIRKQERVQLEPQRRQVREAIEGPKTEMSAAEIIRRYKDQKKTVEELEGAHKRQADLLEDLTKEQRAQTAAAKAAAPVQKQTQDKLAGIAETLAESKKRLEEYNKQFQAMKKSVTDTIGAIFKPLTDLFGYLRDDNQVDLMRAWFGPEWGPRIDGATRDLKAFVSVVGSALSEFRRFLTGELTVESLLNALRTDVGLLDVFARRLWAGLRKAAPELAEQAKSWLISTWQKIPWDQVWATIQFVVGKGVDILGAVKTWLLGVWQSIPWSEVWKGIQFVVGEGVKVVGQIKDWLVTQWALIPWEEVWKGLKFVAGEALKIADQVKTWLLEQWQAVEWEEVWKAGGKLLGGLQTAIGGMIDGLKLALQAAFDAAMKDVKVKGITIPVTFVLPPVPGLPGPGQPPVPENVNPKGEAISAGPGVSGSGTYIGAAPGAAEKAARERAEESGKGIGQAIREGLQVGLGVLADLGDFIGDIFLGVFLGGTRGWESKWGKSLDQWAQEAGRWLRGIVEGIFDPGDWGTWAESNGVGLITAIFTVLFTPSRWTLALGSVLGKIPLVGHLLEVLTKALAGLQGKTGDAVRGKVLEVLADLFRVSPTVMDDLLKTAFKQTGLAIVFGYVSGLVEAGRDAVQSVRNWVMATFVVPVKDALGIQSPSTVFAGIAKEAVAGLLRGLSDAASEVVQAIKLWVETNVLAPIRSALGLDSSSMSSPLALIGKGIGDGILGGFDPLAFGRSLLAKINQGVKWLEDKLPKIDLPIGGRPSVQTTEPRDPLTYPRHSTYSGTRAGGGPVLAGESYLVGEKGPEPFVPSQNGWVLPNWLLQAVRGVQVSFNAPLIGEARIGTEIDVQQLKAELIDGVAVAFERSVNQVVNQGSAWPMGWTSGG